MHIKDGVTLGDQQEISDARGHAQELQLAAVLRDQGAARDQLTDFWDRPCIRLSRDCRLAFDSRLLLM